MEFFKDFFKETDPVVKKVTCIVIVLIIIFSSGYFAGTLSNVNIQANPNTEGQTESVAATTEATTQAPATTVAPTTAPPATTAAPVTVAPATTINSADGTAPTAAPQTGAATQSKDEIIAIFNEAVNKVKPEATKIVRNFKNTRYDTERSVLPSALQSMANPMVEKYVKDDTEPVEYLTKEEIIENFPVPKQDYSSKLTANDVSEAFCTDNGTEYEITLNLAPSTNPTAGTGVGAACHFMDVSSITSNEAASSMIGKFDAVYEGCVIKCKIDKATNRVTWANYYTPFVIDAIVKVVVSEVQTTVYMSYERDYTITY